MRKNILFIILLCCFVIPIKVKAAEGVQSISCTYNVGNYAVTYAVNGTGGGGAIISSNSATKIDVNNRTNYNFSTSENPVVANNFIKDSKLVCPETLYIRYQAGASTNVGVQVSFVKFSDSEAQVPLSRHTDNQKPFITSEITAGKSCQYTGDLTQGSGSVPITITREGDALYYELTNEYKIQINEFSTDDFPSTKNGLCPIMYIHCGSNGNDKYCSLYKSPTATDKMHGYDGQSQDKEIIDEINKIKDATGNIIGSAIGNIEKIENLMFCSQEGVQKALKFIGVALLIAKILVPILLIIFGIIDFAKAVVATDADAIAKSSKSLIFKFLAGVVIFLLPTIVNFIFYGIVKNNANYNQCRACIFERKC